MVSAKSCIFYTQMALLGNILVSFEIVHLVMLLAVPLENALLSLQLQGTKLFNTIQIMP